MPAIPLIQVAKRLLANVDAERGDFVESVQHVPVRNYRDQRRFDAEIEAIF